MRRSFIILTFIGIMLYLPSLFGPFLWDDEDFVYANKYVENFQIDKFFTESQTAGRGKLSNYYRPVPQIVYATTHTIFGFNPFWFHLVNVLAHISAACAIFYFFHLILKGWRNNKSSDKGKLLAEKFSGSNVSGFAHANLQDQESTRTLRMRPENFFGLQSFPLLISLFFLIHPVQTEVVSYISGLSDPLFVLFGFLSLIYYLKSSAVFDTRRGSFLPHYLSLFFFSLSLLSKETGIVFLPLIFLVDFLLHDDKKIASRILTSIRTTIHYSLFTVVYLWYHLTFINKLDMTIAWGDNIYAHSLLVRLLTFINNLPAYLSLLVYPKDLFMERDYSVQIQTNILNPWLLSFIVVNSLLIFVIVKLKNSFQTSNFKLKILLFCYLGFYISFLPYSGLVLINGIFYEHFLYLPLVFFFGFVIFVIASASEAISLNTGLPRRLRLLTMTLVVICLSILAFRNVMRQFDWQDPVRFYSQTLTHAPNSIRIRNGLAMAYADKGDLDSSISEYLLAISLNSRVPNLYHNLANAYVTQNKLDLAEQNYLKAIEVDPSFTFSWQSLANLYQQTNQKEKLSALLQHYQKQL